MKYECENCGAFYSDEDVTEEGEMREDSITALAVARK